jgi:hypothetical protein
MFLYDYWEVYEANENDDSLLYKSGYAFNMLVLFFELVFGALLGGLLFTSGNMLIFTIYIILLCVIFYCTITYCHIIIFDKRTGKIIQKAGCYPFIRKEFVFAFEDVDKISIDHLKVFPTTGFIGFKATKIDEYHLMINGKDSDFEILISTNHDHVSKQKKNIERVIGIEQD